MTPNPAWLFFGTSLPSAEAKEVVGAGGITSVLLAHRDHLPSQLLPTGSQSPGGCGHSGPREFTQLMSHGWPGGGGQLSLLSLHALWDTPPYKPGTHGPPPQPICISKKIHSICFRFIYTSTHHGGAESRAPFLQAPHPHRRAGEHVSPSGTGAVITQSFEPEGQVLTSWAPIG